MEIKVHQIKIQHMWKGTKGKGTTACGRTTLQLG